MKDFTEIIDFTKTMKLLYIEDDELVKNSTSEIFGNIFLEVIEAVDGKDGLEKFYDNKVDLIISAIDMPNLNNLKMIL